MADEPDEATRKFVEGILGVMPKMLSRPEGNRDAENDQAQVDRLSRQIQGNWMAFWSSISSYAHLINVDMGMAEVIRTKATDLVNANLDLIREINVIIQRYRE